MATKIMNKAKRLAAALSPLRTFAIAKEKNELNPFSEIKLKLKISSIKEWRKLTSDYEKIAQHNPQMAEEFLRAASLELAKGKYEFHWETKQNIAAARRIAKQQVFGMIFEPLSSSIKENLGSVFDIPKLYDDEKLSELVSRGKLRKQVLVMARIRNPDEICVERAYAGVGIYKFTITKGKNRKVVFVDETGVLPDMLAAKCLKIFDIASSEMKNVFYNLPNGNKREYGVMKDITQIKDAARVVSIRGIARNKHMSDFVMDNFEEFSKKLGHALEVCRLLGIQDRHNRNVFVIEKTDGAVEIGMIDMDVVGCYSDHVGYQEAFAGQIYHLIESLHFNERFGEFVRENPNQLVMEKIKEEPVDKRREEIIEMSERLLEGFLVGAREANSLFQSRRIQRKIEKLFGKHHGKPVGIGCSQDMLERKLNKLSKKLRQEFINSMEHQAHFQTIIEKGSNRGRIIMDSRYSKKGFRDQLDVQQDEGSTKSKDFWMSTFSKLKRASEIWIRNGSVIKPVTVSY